MGKVGIERLAALEIRRGRGLTTSPPTWDDLIVMATDAGAVVDLDQPFVGQVREVYSHGSIGIRAGMEPCWRRWCLAHGLAHHVLHPRANHLFLGRGSDNYHVRRHEVQAEMFAGYLLFGELLDPPPGVHDVLGVALWADVPFLCAMRWTRLVHYLSAVPPISDRYDIRLEPTGGLDGEVFRDRAKQEC